MKAVTLEARSIIKERGEEKKKRSKATEKDREGNEMSEWTGAESSEGPTKE